MYIKIVLTIINNLSDLSKEVSKSSYPSRRNSQALPTITVTSGPGFTGLTEARLLVNKCNGMLKDPVCANVDCVVCRLFRLFSDDSKDGTEGAWKKPGKSTEKKGCEGSQLEIRVLGGC